MYSCWSHVIAYKKRICAVRAEIRAINEKASWGCYNREYTIQRLHELAPKHPWLRVPLRNSKAWRMPLCELLPIAAQHGITAKGRPTLLKQLFAAAPHLSIF